MVVYLKEPCYICGAPVKKKHNYDCLIKRIYHTHKCVECLEEYQCEGKEGYCNGCVKEVLV